MGDEARLSEADAEAVLRHIVARTAYWRREHREMRIGYVDRTRGCEVSMRDLAAHVLATLAAKDEEVAALQRDRDEWHRVSNAMESARDAAWRRGDEMREVLGVRFGPEGDDLSTAEMARRVVADLVEHEGYERRIAEAVGHDPERCDEWGDVLERIAALRTEDEGNTESIIRLGGLLRRTCDALKGPPEPLHLHSTHDLPEVAAQRMADLTRLRAREERTAVVIEATRDALDYIDNHIVEATGPVLARLEDLDHILTPAREALDATPEHARGPSGVERAPIPFILYCPRCHAQHVDEGEWATRPHRTHLCASCGAEWRPCALATVGVREIERPGQRSDAAEREGEEVGRGE